MTGKAPFSRAVALAAAAALAATPSLIAAQTAVGVNAAIRNSVQIQKAGTAQARPAVLRQRVSLNDEVRTGQASQLQILLLDRSTFTVGANARLRIDRFVYDPARNARSMGATVGRGAFRFMSGRGLRRPAGPVALRTPVASIGVRGTIVEGVVGLDAIRLAAAEAAVGAQAGGDEQTATLILLRGPGPATQGDTAPGVIDVEAGGRNVVLDRPSLAFYVPGGGLPPIGPFMISEAGLLSFQQLLRTVPAAAMASADAGTERETRGAEDPSRGPRPGRALFPLGLAAAAAAVAAVLLLDSGSPDSP